MAGELNGLLQTWLTGNMHKVYPLEDTASGMSTGDTYLPNSLLVDFKLLVPPISGYSGTATTGIFYISAVDCTASSAQISISYKDGDTADFVVAQTAQIPLSLNTGDTVEARTFSLTPTASIPDAYSDLNKLTGDFVIGTCADLTGLGSLSFTSANAALCKDRILVAANAFMSIAFQREYTETSGATVVVDVATMTDNFIFRADDGIEFSLSADNGTPVVIIKRVPTVEETERTLKTTAAIVASVKELLGTPIQSINGVAPVSVVVDSTTQARRYNLNINGLDCTKVSTAGTGNITISNPCAKPCCDNSTPEDVNSALKLLEDAKTRLTAYYESLSTNIYAMQSRLASLISSKS